MAFRASPPHFAATPCHYILRSAVRSQAMLCRVLPCIAYPLGVIALLDMPKMRVEWDGGHHGFSGHLEGSSGWGDGMGRCPSLLVDIPGGMRGRWGLSENGVFSVSQENKISALIVNAVLCRDMSCAAVRCHAVRCSGL